MAYVDSGVSIIGSLFDNNDTNEYTVYLRAGDTYDFFMEGDTGGAAYLHDPKLTIAGLGQSASDDDSSNGLNADLKFTPTTTGSYTLTVDGLGPAGAGFYGLVMTNTSFVPDIADHIGTLVGTDTKVAAGGWLHSDIASAFDTDIVAVQLLAGMPYIFDLRGASTGAGTLLDPYLTLMNSDGQVLQQNNNGGFGNDAQIVFTPGSDGTYYLKLHGDSAGTYELKVNAVVPYDDVPDSPVGTTFNVPLGDSIVGNVDAAFDKDVYAIHLTAGSTYGFDLGTYGVPDPSLSLLDHNGVTVASAFDWGPLDDAHFMYQATESGVYYLKAGDAGGGTGLYVLSADLLSAPPSPLQVVTSNQDSAHSAIYDGSDWTDQITGGSGNDTMNGELGNDTLAGGAGNDILTGGEGVDLLIGGAGNDTFTFDGSDTVSEGVNGGIDTVNSSLTYTLGANVENLNLTGLGAINGTGNALDNTIYGNGGANILNGAAGADTLIGGSGNDTFVGGAGKDLMTGGGGLDHFNFAALADSGTSFATRDVINTYAHGDKIDLSALDANANAAGNQAFSFVTDFTHVAGQLEWTQTAPTGYLIQGDTNGDGAADFSLQIYAAPNFGTLHNWDFVL